MKDKKSPLIESLEQNIESTNFEDNLTYSSSISEEKWRIRDYQAAVVGTLGAGIGAYLGYRNGWSPVNIFLFTGGFLLLAESGLCRILDDYHK